MSQDRAQDAASASRPRDSRPCANHNCVMSAPRILLGRIGAAHGIRGDVLVASFTEPPESIASYGPLWDSSGTRTFRIHVVRVTAKGVIVRIDGVADRTAAEALRGTELWIERARLPAAEANEFYHVDLIGLRAVAPDGGIVGRVVAVENYGAGDLLDIRLEGTSRTELVPFTDAFVPEVDVAGGRVVVRIPEEAPDEDDDPQADRP